METVSTTTYAALAPRAAATVARLDETDPIRRANALIDEANTLVDAGEYDRADALFAAASALLDGEAL